MAQNFAMCIFNNHQCSAILIKKKLFLDDFCLLIVLAITFLVSNNIFPNVIAEIWGRGNSKASQESTLGQTTQ